MEREEVLEIRGGRPLNGQINISGAKNSVLPVMVASILTNKPILIKNVPDITDVTLMAELLKTHGISAEVAIAQKQVRITASNVGPSPNDATISGQFRASILVLGPLLARVGQARVYLPGGDEIDSRGRPVDMHITNFKSLGATVSVEQDWQGRPFIYAEARNGLRAPGRPIVLPKVSVGATQNTIMAACAANGTTIIQNASIEPETLDLVKLLRKMGAQISVNPQNRQITITGKDISNYQAMNWQSSSTIEHTVIPDRIVAGTYAIAAVITGGTIELVFGNVENATIIDLLEAEFWRLLAAGVDVKRIARGRVQVTRKRDSRTGGLQPISPVSVKTKPYPGFPTDMHPQWAALMCFSNGSSWVEENIFDGRFGYVDGLQEMNAAIFRDPSNRKKVNITGRPALHQNLQATVEVNAGDIRAGAALVLAAIARNGVTKITGLKHLDRGYEDLVSKFTTCGVRMQRYSR